MAIRFLLAWTSLVRFLAALYDKDHFTVGLSFATAHCQDSQIAYVLGCYGVCATWYPFPHLMANVRSEIHEPF